MWVDQRIVRIAKALADSTRVKILREIARRGSITCGEAQKISGRSQATVSHHIKLLTDAGLLDAQKRGRRVFVCMNKRVMARFASYLSSAITHSNSNQA